MQKKALCQKIKKIVDQESLLIADVDEALVSLKKLKKLCGDNESSDYLQMRKFFQNEVTLLYKKLKDSHEQGKRFSALDVWNYSEKLIACLYEQDARIFFHTHVFYFCFSLENDEVYQRMAAYCEKNKESYFYELILLQIIERMIISFKDNLDYCHLLLKNIKKLQINGNSKCYHLFSAILSAFF